MWDEQKYEQLKIIVQELETRESNFKKSSNRNFRLDFLIEKRQKTVRQKVSGVKLAKDVLNTVETEAQKLRTYDKFDRVRACAKRILAFIKLRVVRKKTESVELVNFHQFLVYLEGDALWGE